MRITAQRALTLVASVAFAGCYAADVDRAVYASGKEGIVSVSNFTDEPAWLKGFCDRWTLEQWVDGDWELRFGRIDPRPPGIYYDGPCTLGGRRLEPGETRQFSFTTIDADPLPAKLRIRFEVGVFCEETRELEGGGTLVFLDPPCEEVFSVSTPPFVVNP